MAPDHAFIVTGAASGIGHATTVRLTERGHRVISLDVKTPTEVDIIAGSKPVFIFQINPWAVSRSGNARLEARPTPPSLSSVWGAGLWHHSPAGRDWRPSWRKRPELATTAGAAAF